MQVRTASRMRRIGLAVLVTVVAIGVVVVVLWTLQRRLVYFPGGEPPPVDVVLPDGREVALTTDDGLELTAWFIDRGPVAVLVLPGNAGNRAARVPLAEALADAGMSVLLVDYRGYGGNPGSPSEDGLVADARAGRAWLDRQDGIEQVVYLGESLGAGVAVALSTEAPPAALILRSPFPSLVAVARQHYGPVPRWLLRDRFEAGDAIGDIDAPVLVVAGGGDRIVPPALSEAVHRAALEPARFVLVEGAGHNDRALLDGDEFVAAILSFLRDHLDTR